MVDLTALQQALLSDGPIRPALEQPQPEDMPELPDEPEYAQPAPPLGKAARRLLDANLATLTPVELVERLGLSMHLQRSGTASATGSAPAPRRKIEPSPTRSNPAPARTDNEQVLRSALAALQRLSGAA